MEFINDSNLQENPYFNPNKKNPLTILIPISFPISIILMINDPNPIKIPIPIPIPISFPIHYLNIRVLGSNYTKKLWFYVFCRPCNVAELRANYCFRQIIARNCVIIATKKATKSSRNCAELREIAGNGIALQRFSI